MYGFVCFSVKISSGIVVGSLGVFMDGGGYKCGERLHFWDLG